MYKQDKNWEVYIGLEMEVVNSAFGQHNFKDVVEKEDKFIYLLNHHLLST